jgi:hypothetical protein
MDKATTDAINRIYDKLEPISQSVVRIETQLNLLPSPPKRPCDFFNNHLKMYHKDKTEPKSFPYWLIANWRTICFLAFGFIWALNTFFTPNKLSPEQQKEIEEILKTVVIDTRPN